jgi:hypothetical protein
MQALGSAGAMRGADRCVRMGIFPNPARVAARIARLRRNVAYVKRASGAPSRTAPETRTVSRVNSSAEPMPRARANALPWTSLRARHVARIRPAQHKRAAAGAACAR